MNKFIHKRNRNSNVGNVEHGLKGEGILVMHSPGMKFYKMNLQEKNPLLSDCKIEKNFFKTNAAAQYRQIRGLFGIFVADVRCWLSALLAASCCLFGFCDGWFICYLREIASNEMLTSLSSF